MSTTSDFLEGRGRGGDFPPPAKLSFLSLDFSKLSNIHVDNILIILRVGVFDA